MHAVYETASSWKSSMPSGRGNIDNILTMNQDFHDVPV